MFDAKGGEGSSMLDLGGVIHLGGVYLLYLAFYVLYTIMHSCVYFHASNYIYVIVIFTKS